MCGIVSLEAGRNIQYSCDKENFIDNLVRFGGFTVLAITPQQRLRCWKIKYTRICNCYPRADTPNCLVRRRPFFIKRRCHETFYFVSL